MNSLDYAIWSTTQFLGQAVSTEGTVSTMRCIVIGGFLYSVWLGVYSKLTGTLDAPTVDLIKWVLFATVGGKALQAFGENSSFGNNVQPNNPLPRPAI